MNFEEFKKLFILNLKNNNEDCISLIKNYKKIILEYLTEKGDPKVIKDFVNEINDIILSNKVDLKLFKAVLKNDNLKYIYSVFKKSDILIQSCKYGLVETIKWLLTMDINPYVQDKEGMTALMYAVKNEDLIFVVKAFNNDFKCCNIEDKNGNNALFHSVNNISALLQINEVDINHLNNNHETVLLYCCKNEIYEPIKILIGRNGINLSIFDNEGKTALMYLMEKERENEINYVYILGKGKAFNDVNEWGESVLSIFAQKMYRKDSQINGVGNYSSMANILISLVKSETDFNIVVDKDGNTALMVFLIAHDFNTFNFVTLYSKNLDFSKKNMYGENATSLFLKIKGTSIYGKSIIQTQSTFDYDYIDPINKNTALILAIINNPSIIEDILKINYNSINNLNNAQENALIIAAKMNDVNSIKILLNKNINVNQQDNTGNTALHYAIKNKNMMVILELIKYGANVNIINNKNETSLELAKCSNNKDIINVLNDNTILFDSKVMINIKPSIIPQLNEYLYPCISNLYIEMTYKGKIQNEIGLIYNEYTKNFNQKKENLKFINNKYFYYYF